MENWKLNIENSKLNIKNWKLKLLSFIATDYVNYKIKKMMFN